MPLVTLTGSEVTFAAKDQLISTTDIQGRITYANDEFIKISGYSHDELLGSPHRIVRHPFMPKAAFENMWAMLKQDKPWRGLVVNKCKNGNYYWVDAYVTPVYQNGEKVGYQSVRALPSAAQKQDAIKMYNALNNGNNPIKQSVISSTLFKTGLFALLSLVLLGALFVKGEWLLGLLLVLLQGGGLAGLYLGYIKPLNVLANKAKAISSNEVMQKLFTGRLDNIGAVEYGLQMQSASTKTVLGRLGDFCGEIDRVVTASESISIDSKQGANRQSEETDMVAVSVEELAASALEISQSMTATSDAVQQANNEALDGRNHLEDIIEAISSISQQMELAEKEAQNLKQHTVEIEHVIGVITEIAEQTNLLALNAAIEAARAGEYGRGFAVVADEVRTLATRTKDSTSEVRTTVENIVSSVGMVVSKLDQTKGVVEKSRSVSGAVEQVFSSVTESMNGISGQTVSVASAAGQQTSVIEEIQKNVESLRQLSQHNADLGAKSESASKELRAVENQLLSMVKAFKTEAND